MKNYTSVQYKNVGKVLESVIARSNNLLRGSLKENIFFLHVHKCAGTSINQAVKSCYLTFNIKEDRNLAHLESIPSFKAAKISVNQADFPSDAQDDYQVLRFREELLLYYFCQEHIKYVAGHFSFSAAAHQSFSDKYVFITVLREPVARLISTYFFNRYKSWNHRKIEVDIKEYLKSELGQAQGSEYVKFLGGANPNEEYTSEHAVNRAKQNLHKFSIVGCLEYQQDFIDKFEKRFGRRLKIGVSNRSPEPRIDRSSIITEELIEEMKEICKPDIKVYQYAIKNFINTVD